MCEPKWRAITQLFCQTYFPDDGPAGIMEVFGVIFRKRKSPGDVYPRWIPEDGDIWQCADRMVDEMLDHLDGRITLNDIERIQSKYNIMHTISCNSPDDGRDIVVGLSRRGALANFAFPSSESVPTVTA